MYGLKSGLPYCDFLICFFFWILSRHIKTFSALETTVHIAPHTLILTFKFRFLIVQSRRRQVLFISFLKFKNDVAYCNSILMG